MRTSPYSLDFREKVIEFIESGNTQVKASEHFKIALNTVNQWHQRYRKEGHYRPRKRLGRKGRVCPAILKQYLSEHPNSLLKNIGDHFNMSIGGASYWMKKLGYVYKKKASPTWSLTLKNKRSI